MSVSSIRIVPELRAVHIDRHRNGTPAELLYLTENYDFAGTAIIDGVHRVTLRSALRRFWSTSASTLEVPEPLWMRFWPKHAVLATGFKLAGLTRRRQHTVVTYAMENNEITTLVGGDRRIPRWMVMSIVALIGGVARVTLDRICFASDQAHRTYAAVPFMGTIPHRTFLELPSPTVAAAESQRRHCVFVGVLEDRKGIRALMTAWPIVEAMLPAAHLSIIGPGPILNEAATWASRNPSQRRVHGALPHTDTTQQLHEAAVLVAPSQPDGRWREQIGLPIKEALASGLTVVTTNQTGLATWLSEHGHEVLDPHGAAFPRQLAQAIVRALNAPLHPDAVRQALPQRDGRLTADAWLHQASSQQPSAPQTTAIPDPRGTS